MFFRVRPRVRIEPGLIRIYRGALFEGSSAGRDNKKVCTVYRVDYKKYKLRLNKLEVPLFGTLKYLRSVGQRTRLSTARPRFQPIRAHQAFGRNLDKAFPVPLLRCQGTLNTSYTSWYCLSDVEAAVAPTLQTFPPSLLAGNPSFAGTHGWGHLRRRMTAAGCTRRLIAAGNSAPNPLWGSKSKVVSSV